MKLIITYVNFPQNETKYQIYDNYSLQNASVQCIAAFMPHKELRVILTLYSIKTPSYTFANRADSDQAALTRAAWSESTLFAYGNRIYLILH